MGAGFVMPDAARLRGATVPQDAERRPRGRAQRTQPRDGQEARPDGLDLPGELAPAGVASRIAATSPSTAPAKGPPRATSDGHDPARSARPARRPWRARARRRPSAGRARGPLRPRRPRGRARSTRRPAASSRSMSTIAFAMARAVPAFAAAGTRTRNTPGSVPVAPNQPNTGQQRGCRPRTAATRASCPSPGGRTRGRSRGPTARKRDEPRAPDQREDEAAAAADPTATTRAVRSATTSPAGIGFPGLRPASPGASTMSLSAFRSRTGAASSTGRARSRPRVVPPADHGDEGHDGPVEDRRERVDEPDAAADDAGRTRAAGDAPPIDRDPGSLRGRRSAGPRRCRRQT